LIKESVFKGSAERRVTFLFYPSRLGIMIPGYP